MGVKYLNLLILMFYLGNNFTKEGEIIILFLGYGIFKSLKLKSGEYYNSMRGSYRHNDFIGKPWGTRVFSRFYKKKMKKRKLNQRSGFVYLLKPSPDLWTLAVEHRTQILYFTDISMIVFRLGIKPGDTVIESGTGSGSLTIHLIRSLYPTGHLYSFELNQNRIKIARTEFLNLQIHSYVTIINRNVCQKGFPLDRKFYSKGIKFGVDVIFMDLPNPVKPLISCFEILNENCQICSFSPCIEQVQKTNSRLKELGFINIETIEILTQHLEVKTQTFKPLPCSDIEGNLISMSSTRPYSLMFGHTGYLTFALKPPKLK